MELIRKDFIHLQEWKKRYSGTTSANIILYLYKSDFVHRLAGRYCVIIKQDFCKEKKFFIDSEDEYYRHAFYAYCYSLQNKINATYYTDEYSKYISDTFNTPLIHDIYLAKIHYFNPDAKKYEITMNYGVSVPVKNAIQKYLGLPTNDMACLSWIISNNSAVLYDGKKAIYNHSKPQDLFLALCIGCFAGRWNYETDYDLNY